MLRGLRDMIERQIAKAQQEGLLDGLQGEGKPLPMRDLQVDAGLKMMADAGVLPEEFELKKQLDAARSAYQDAQNEDARNEIMKQIADLEMRYNISVDARRRFMR